MINKKLFFLISILLSFKLLANEVDVITSIKNNLTITKYEVRQLFLMKRKRINGNNSVVLIQMNQNSILHKKFLRDVLNLSSEQYNQIINNSNNTGFSGYVITVNTREDMIKQILDNDNSIGYIDKDYLIINSLDSSISIFKIID